MLLPGKETWSHLEAIVDMVVDGIITIDDHGLIETFNPAAQKIFGYSAEEMLARNVNLLMSQADRDTHDQYLDNYTDNGHSKIVGRDRELIGVRKDGSTFPMELSVNGREILGRRIFTWVVRDITERKQSEVALQRAHDALEQRVLERTAELEKANDELKREIQERKSAETNASRIAKESEIHLRNMHDIFYVVDREGCFEYLNPEAEALFSRSSEELIGKIIWDEFPELAAYFYRKLKTVANTGEPITFDGYYPPQGKWFTSRVYPSGNGVAVYSMDITPRKKAEQALNDSIASLNRSNDFLANIMDSASIGIFVVTPKGIIERINRAGAVMAGHEVNDLIGESLDKLFEGNEEEMKRVAKIVARCTKDGESLDGCTTTVLHADKTKHKISFSLRPIWKGDRIVGAVSTAENITARLQTEAELRRYAKKLEFSNRELEDFAYVASHDLQEPLRKIEAFGDRLAAKYAAELGEDGKSYLERMQSAAGRMRALINDLLSYSRVSTKTKPFARVNLGKIAEEVLSDLETRIEETGAQVVIQNLPEITADPSQMRQLFQNLIGNALKYHRQNVPPMVTVAGRLVTEQNSEPALGAYGQELCEITVEDNGIGFEKKYEERIFKVFERLHSRTEYEGTGVGLAACRKIADQHDGKIAASGVPGQGSIFSVIVPVHHPEG